VHRLYIIESNGLNYDFQNWFLDISTSKFILAKAALKFIVIESVMPILLQIPMLIASVISAVKLHDFSAQAMHFFTGIYLAHSFIDPIVLILMTRPYKRQLLRMFRHIVPDSGTVATTN